MGVQPAAFSKAYSIGVGLVPTDTAKLGIRVQNQPAPEELANVVQTDGDALIVDDTAICHTESTFACPGGEADYETEVNKGLCIEKESVKIQEMCRDSPCDKDAESKVCKAALDKCQYDPESGVMCMPNSENDPCIECVCQDDNSCFNDAYKQQTANNANAVGLALTCMAVL